jgi:colanic acid/amylovoran biosynthesis glycosyltransferase
MPAEAVTIGVIASMKRGLEPFVHRELAHLQRLGHRIRLLPTKVGPGLYGPDPSWDVLTHRPWRLLAGHLEALARAPRRYGAALAEAWRFRALTEFVLAGGHARAMRDVDVLYATFGDRKLFVGYFLKRLNGTRLAVTVHAYELYDNPNPGMFRHALPACDRVSTVTEYNRELLIADFGLDPEAVAVTRIAVDTERYRPRATFAILIVAFFNDGKGHEDLFEAVRRLDDPDVEVWVVGGEGPAAPVDVRAAAARLGVADQVAFFGPLRGPPLEALYRRCDVFCLPSHTAASGVKEGFPTVIAEAMAFGRPVVSTRHVEIPRILDEAIVPERDVAALTEALRALRDDPARRAAMGADNRRRAERLFTLRNVEATGDALVALARADAARRPPTAATAVAAERRP